MADDVTYTSTSPAGPPNGTKQATDEHVTRGHMPLVKLAYSADGDATPITADANGLEVQGAVTATLASGDRTVLDAIAQSLDDAIDGGQMQVDVVTLPAADRTTDSISAALASDALMADQVQMSPVRTNVALSSDGTILAAVSGVRHLVVALDIEVPSGVTFQIDDGSGGTRLLGPYTKSRVLPLNQFGWARGSTNTLLHFNLTAGSGTVSITVTSFQVPA